MTLREWAKLYPGRDMKHLRLSGPTGDPWTLAHAWRVGPPEPVERAGETQVGLFLHAGDETQGTCKTVFTSWDALMDNWTTR